MGGCPVARFTNERGPEESPDGGDEVGCLLFAQIELVESVHHQQKEDVTENTCVDRKCYVRGYFG